MVSKSLVPQPIISNVIVVFLLCSIVSAATPGDDFVNTTVARASFQLPKAGASSLYDSPTIPTKNQLYIEPPVLTGSSYRVYGNYIRFPSDISDVISDAKSQKKGIEIFAIHVHMTGYINLAGVPHLKIVSHNCVMSSGTYIWTYGTRPSYSRVAGATSVTPPKQPSVSDSGHVDIMCTQITSPSAARLGVYTYGLSGIRGRNGGPGRSGSDGTPGKAGFCRSKRIKFIKLRIKCETHRGHAGRPSTAGSSGARGGSGGDGGDGGNFNLIYDSIARHTLSVATNEAGGRGGTGGSGGAAGKNGKYIARINYVTGCSSRCKVGSRYKTEVRPRLPTLRKGSTGSSGRTGRSGVTKISTRLDSTTTSITDQDIVRSLLLAERYYNDLVLAESFQEAVSIMESIYTISIKRQQATGKLGSVRINPMIRTIGDRALMARKTLQLERSLFGPAALSRIAPISIGKELESELKYLEALKDQMTSSKIRSDVLAVVTAAAAISIPATDFGAARRNLQSQRDTFRRAVVETEARIEDASSTIQVEIEKHIAKKQDEADRARQGKIFKAIKSVVNIAVGVASINFVETFNSAKAIIGTIKDIKVSFDDIKAIKSSVEDIRDEFKKLKNETDLIKEVLSTAVDVAGEVKTVTEAFKKAESSSTCSFADIKALMQAAPDRIDKFPNLVVYEADFSEIEDIGVVSDLSKALVNIRASTLTSQFGCVLGEKLEDLPAIKTAFDNFFTLTETRVNILSRMVDIDIELRKLKISEEGVLAQKSSLQVLRTSVGTRTTSNAVAILGVVFENARLRVLETMERLANSYEHIVLRDMQKVIKAYAEKQLSDNGVCGFDQSKLYSTVVKLHVDLKYAYQVAHRCMTSRESPSTAYYSFDITEMDSPELFAGGLRPGKDNEIALKLDIEKNCAFYAGNRPPSRGMSAPPLPQSACFPNQFTYNARMISIGLELVGGDEALLPPYAQSAFSIIDQVGAQSFHSKPGTFRKLDMSPLQIGLGFLSLTTKGSSSDVVYHTTCPVGGAGLTSVDLDAPRVCPSPFSTYSLKIGHIRDTSLDPYLASVKAIRIHTRLVAFSRRDTASVCFE